MTQVAFSHQFSHHWTQAPQQVKNALIQEFDDIVRLLDEETDLETFEFSVPDLHAHIDNIYLEIANSNSTQPSVSETAAADVSEADTLVDEVEATSNVQTATPEHTDTDSQDMEASVADIEETNVAETKEVDTHSQLNATKHTAEDLAPTESQAQPLLNKDSSRTTMNMDSAKDMDSAEYVDGTKNLEITKDNADAPALNAATLLQGFKFETKKGALDAEFIKELEVCIDDYLTEQLTNLSEDLKSWLQHQIKTRQGD